MKQRNVRAILIAVVTAANVANGLSPRAAMAASAGEIDQNATQTLITIYQTTPGAKALAGRSRAVLFFSDIVKAGFIAV
jgi:hypothetical protein